MFDEEAQPPRRHGVDTIRALMPLVFIGFAMSMCSLLILSWPGYVKGDAPTSASTHLSRLTDELANGASLARIMVDAGMYLMMLIGFVLVLMVWGRRQRNLLIWIIAIALLGLAYASSMALYTGPMFYICGFLLMLFGCFIALTATSASDIVEPEPVPESGTTNPVIPETYHIPDEAPQSTLYSESQNDQATTGNQDDGTSHTA